MAKPVEPVYRLLGAKVEIANLETGRQRLMMHHVETVALAFGTTPKHLMKGIWT